MFLDAFKKIDNEYKGLPFWSWNGLLDKQELLRQLMIIKEMGFGGFFMHSRTGLATEYLGEEWMECVNFICEQAYKMGLKAWLYDEDRWPSGTAGGEVTKNLKYRMKFISMNENSSKKEFEISKQSEYYIKSFAVKLNNKSEIEDYYCLTDYSQLKSEYKVMNFMIEYMQCEDFYNGQAYLDTLNKDATIAFLDSTHNKYKKYCGNRFGKELIGIFSDEPFRGTILNDFSIKNENKLNMLPYTYTLFKEFQNSYGFLLEDKLPELYFLVSGKSVNSLMYKYIKVLQDMFINNFAIPYKDFCRENKLIFSGHVLHKDSLIIQTIFQGSAQRFYEYFDYPGIDILTEWNTCYQVPKQAQSVARQLGKPFVATELYGCTGWELNFSSHRDIGTWQALLGANMRCLHLSWYTMEGECKRDCPGSIFYHSNWYKDYTYIENYFARLNKSVSYGEQVCEVLVVNPIESVWLYPKKGWSSAFTPLDDNVKEIDNRYTQLFNILIGNQIDFDYGDEDIIARHSNVGLEFGEPIFRVGNAKYKKIILSNLHCIRSTTVKLINQFVELGGKVITIGRLPIYVDGEPKKILENLCPIEFCEQSILEALKDNNRIYTIENSEGAKQIIATLRYNKSSNDYVLCMLNKDRTNAYDIEINFSNKFCVVNNNLSDGSQSLLGEASKKLKMRFSSGECKVISLHSKSNIAKVKDYKIVDVIKNLNEFDYDLDELNVYPLDFATLHSSGFNIDKKQEILKIDRLLRQNKGYKTRGWDNIQPWYQKKYCKSTSKIEEEINLEFEFYVLEIQKDDIFLVMEQSELFNVTINGLKVNTKTNDYWIDKCFDKIRINNQHIRIGKNVIKAVVNFTEKVNIEAMYLLGKFGVKLDGEIKEIVNLPKKLKLGSILNQGLPFYSGTISYKTKITNKKVQVCLDKSCGAFVKLKDNSSKKIIAFAPYTDIIDLDGELIIDVCLTRRNTFGPLHLKNVITVAYGSDSFITEGDDFMNEYALIEQGLSKNLIINIIK